MRWGQLKAMEELNRIFVEIYGMVGGEVPIEVKGKYISVTRSFDANKEILELFLSNKCVIETH